MTDIKSERKPWKTESSDLPPHIQELCPKIVLNCYHRWSTEIFHDEVFSDGRITMLTDHAMNMQVFNTCSVPNIICITQIIFKKRNNALYVYNQRLDFLDTQNFKYF